MITFDKNIPIPKAKIGRKKSDTSIRAILESMDIYDSYLFNGLKTNSVRAAASAIKLEKRYVCRTIDGVVRVWRTK